MVQKLATTLANTANQFNLAIGKNLHWLFFFLWKKKLNSIPVVVVVIKKKKNHWSIINKLFPF
jgi:hypothetical protein